MNSHDGPPHGGGAVDTCRLCRAIADDIVRRALGAPTRKWYVSAIYGTRKRLVAGPFDTVGDALDAVRPATAAVARDYASDPRVAFAGYGVSSSFDALATVYGTSVPTAAAA